MKCGVDKLSNANISKLLFVNIEQGVTQLAIGIFDSCKFQLTDITISDKSK